MARACGAICSVLLAMTFGCTDHGGTGGADGGGGSISSGGGDGGTDAGDGGTTVTSSTPLPVSLPTASGWTFYGPGDGLPNTIFGASYDEGGNLWVAGGEDGLFVLRAGGTKFQRLTMADGLRPYGYMPDGSVPPGPKYLKVISVSGAWAGTAFVGYEGRPPDKGELDCESNWDGPNPDPSIYKSGDADRVTLDGAGIDVVHYDISSGPGIVGGELRGREKLCDVYRVRYDKVNDRVWFGANHGIAMGLAHYAGTGSCEWEPPGFTPPDHKTNPYSNEYGHVGCNGLQEHAHPAVDGLKSDGTCCNLWTGGYYGVSVDPVTDDVWFGGQIRTTKFKYASNGHDFYAAQSQTEDPPYISNRIDVWPDKVGEPNYPSIADRVDDAVSGAAAMPDGTVWLSSFSRGLAHLASDGTVMGYLTQADGLVGDKLSSLARDPADDSLWTGPNYVGGLSRVGHGTVTNFDETVLGDDLYQEGVPDIQSSGTGASRRMVVSFGGNATNAGAVGVYSGP